MASRISSWSCFSHGHVPEHAYTWVSDGMATAAGNAANDATRAASDAATWAPVHTATRPPIDAATWAPIHTTADAIDADASTSECLATGTNCTNGPSGEDKPTT